MKTVSMRFMDMAENIEDKARAVLESTAVVNTNRRARMSGEASARAREDIRLAQTLRNLAEAFEDGNAVYMNGFTTKAKIEVLDLQLRRALYARYRTFETYKDASCAEVSVDDIPYLEYPYPLYYGSFTRDLLNGDLSWTDRMMLEKYTKEFGRVDSEDADAYAELAKRLPANSNARITAEEYKRIKKAGINDIEDLKGAALEYLTYRATTMKEDPIKKLERALVGVPIPGYFPTPKTVIEIMLKYAGIKDGDRVLEPSAGKGSIADAVKGLGYKVDIDVCEVYPMLQEILLHKGYNLVGSDILDYKGKTYNKIVMNPPFEHGQDAEHVMYVHDKLLEPGGVLVSVVGAGVFFRQDQAATEFRGFLKDAKARTIDLPVGAFLDSERSTGVNTKLVVITKGETNVRLK